MAQLLVSFHPDGHLPSVDAHAHACSVYPLKPLLASQTYPSTMPIRLAEHQLKDIQETIVHTWLPVSGNSTPYLDDCVGAVSNWPAENMQ